MQLPLLLHLLPPPQQLKNQQQQQAQVQAQAQERARLGQRRRPRVKAHLPPLQAQAQVQEQGLAPLVAWLPSSQPPPPPPPPLRLRSQKPFVLAMALSLMSQLTFAVESWDASASALVRYALHASQPCVSATMLPNSLSASFS